MSEPEVLERAVEDTTNKSWWILLDPQVFNYSGVDMILVTDTTLVGIKVTIAERHSSLAPFFALWRPLAESHKMQINGLFVTPGSFVHEEDNVETIAGLFFKTCLDEEGVATGYKSRKACGKCRKHLSGTGYTNLVSHVRSAHPNFEVDIRNASAAATDTLGEPKGLEPLRVAPLDRHVQPPAVLLRVRAHAPVRFTSLPVVSVDTLRANMESVTRAVERLIGAEMPQKLGFILDGWSHGTEQYLAVYGCYETPDGLCYPLLSMAPVMQDEDVRLTAESHMAAIARILPFFGKTLSDC
ncbi:unnamed protein product [Phytophthora fragariaefolia]|uniref:Unnamed protein product n=1 Tax=Phytophthora fragariaefolia TaxID=1490495 RepID=A0A9W6YMN2_9STRA|nr:unnamed protein product [Phytophthora fragariaefolia]